MSDKQTVQETAMPHMFISLLYPDEASYEFHLNRRNLPHISEETCDALGLTELFRLKNGQLCDFFTASEEVLRYRQATVNDLLCFPALRKTLSDVRPVLDDICELRLLDADHASKDAYLYSITEIELYVSCLELLKEGLAPLREQLTSTAFRSLCSFVFELTESAYYKDLNKQLSALSSRVHEIRSMTIGVNFDAQFRPTEAGVLSVNSETFKSGKTLDKILRFSFRNDAFTTIAELTPCGKGQSENKQEALLGAFYGARTDIYRSSVKGWRQTVDAYVSDNTDFLLKLLPEIEFVCRSCELIETLRSHPGCAMTFPRVADASEHAFVAYGLYNPRVALAIEEEIVTNDLVFDDMAGMYVLTGPNRGGKSVITVACGAAQAMFQLGLPVPAAEATLSVVDGIFTHFPEDADDTIDKGRLGEECARLREIFNQATSDSLILLDESLSSTGAYEASYIASEILAAFAALGCRGIFSTHLHELAASIDDINRRSLALGGVRIDTLVAGMEEGQRSFKIARRTPDGKSYARDIAEKYGLSFDRLTARIRDGGTSEPNR